MTININDTVEVKLTPYGKTILERYYDTIHLTLSKHHQPNKDGYYKFSLWDLMHIFGTKTTMGNNQVFEDNLIHTPESLAKVALKVRQANNREATRELVKEYIIYRFKVHEIEDATTIEAIAIINGHSYISVYTTDYDTKEAKRLLIKFIAFAYAKENDIDDGLKLIGPEEMIESTIETYKYKQTCRNCGKQIIKDLPMGTDGYEHMRTTTCPRCGCVPVFVPPGHHE